MISRKRILFEEEDTGPEWIATFHLGNLEFDDDFEDSNMVEIVLNAIDFDKAVRYAQQYLRKMKTEEDTATEWADAEILSVELR